MVIATVFLTIIGMTGGFVLGERHRRALAASESSAQNSSTQNSPTQDSPAQDTPTPRTPAPYTGRAVVPSAQAPSKAGSVLCPEQTRATSASLGLSATLWQVMKIQTEDGTTVWICQDDTGGYYYQGKTGGPDAALVQNQNGLFLDNVRHSEDREEYVALASNGNRFVVNRKQLEIYFAKTKKTQISKVVATQ